MTILHLKRCRKEILINRFGKMFHELIVVCFKVSQNLSGGSRENSGELHVRLEATGMGIESVASQLLSSDFWPNLIMDTVFQEAICA
jgi:hypothetical protein